MQQYIVCTIHSVVVYYCSVCLLLQDLVQSVCLLRVCLLLQNLFKASAGVFAGARDLQGLEGQLCTGPAVHCLWAQRGLAEVDAGGESGGRGRRRCLGALRADTR